MLIWFFDFWKFIYVFKRIEQYSKLDEKLTEMSYNKTN